VRAVDAQALGVLAADGLHEALTIHRKAIVLVGQPGDALDLDVLLALPSGDALDDLPYSVHRFGDVITIEPGNLFGLK
jgi:hypothetical protein